MAITNSEVNGTVDVLTVPAGKSYAVTSILITNVGPEASDGSEDSNFTLYAVTGSYSSNDYWPSGYANIHNICINCVVNINYTNP